MAQQDRADLDGHAAIEIAIVGMSCRYPGARDVAEFWRNLRGGVESISRFSEQQLRASGVDPSDLRDPEYVRAGGVVDGIELFDADFFGLTPRAAEVLDPQQRLLLECSWEALESAGCDPGRYQGSIGVFAGQALSDYLRLVEADRELVRLLGRRAVMIGNDKDHLTTSISYRLNLRGPAVTVQTTCSTSLVAVHLACQSLLGQECDMALAGGVSLRIPQQTGYVRQQGVSSRDGRCRAFDAGADGSVPSGGVGVVLLRPLLAALEHGDPIHAVIKGSALNNDGSKKVGYTAPSVEGQAAVIAQALEVAEVDAQTVGYVEAHGTGTPLGDPIEIAALTAAYREHTKQRGYRPIGSVKTNIGHTDAAAGVAGLIKAVLALQHEAIPPSLNFEEPNPEIDFAGSPFFVNASLRPWPRTGVPRRAGVSSFGIGGTNAHVILEEAPAPEPGGPSAPWQVLALSARTRPALHRQASRVGAALVEHPDVPIADVAHTLRLGRPALPNRAIAVCGSTGDAAAVLGSHDRERLFEDQGVQSRPVTFMFPGGSAPYEAATRELYDWEPVFRAEVDRCAALLEPEIAGDVRSILYPDGPASGDATTPLEALPALFTVAFALARLWLSWGLRPAAMIGHSLGEYVAACLAGVLDLPDALRLVAVRSRLIQAIPHGAMLSVALPESRLADRLGERLSVAAVNSPGTTVVSGPDEAVAGLEQALAAEGVAVSRLPIRAAGHSALVEPIVDEFLAFVRTLPLAPPQIPYVSGTTGTWIRAEEATDPVYWARHLRQTVRFSAGLASLLQDPSRALLEVGPGRTLASLAGRHPSRRPEHLVLASLPHPDEPVSALAFLYATLGRLWAAGADVDWSAFRTHERRRRVALPTYPFERQRYWVDAGPAEPSGSTSGGREPAAAPPAPDGDDVEAVCRAQLEVIRRQLELLRGVSGA